MSTPNHAAAAGGSHVRILSILLAATFTVFLNETIMNVALVPLQKDLHVDSNTVQWLTTAFMLTMAVVIPTTGYILQRLSTRVVFTMAMVFFSAGTLVALIALGFPMLLIGRIIQAFGTAIMMPLMMTTIMEIIPATSRGKIMGNVSIVISVAPAIGPAIAGFLLQLGSWRWLFAVVLPIAVVMLVVGNLKIPNVNEPRKAPLDPVSVVFSAIGFAGLVYGFSKLTSAGRDPGVMLLCLGVGVVGLALFVWRQLRLQRTDRALLDLRIFSHRIFNLSVITMVVAMMGLFGTIVLLPFYLQQVLHANSVTVGLLLMPGGLVMGLASPITGRMYDKFGPRSMLIPGTIIGAAALWLFATLHQSSSVWHVLAYHVLLSIGLAMTFTPLFTAGLGDLPPRLYSFGSAAMGTVQQVAGAAGTAVFVSIMSAQSLAAATSGAGAEAATASGIRLAFIIGAIIFTLTVGIAAFIRKPVEAGPMETELAAAQSGS